MKIFRLLTFAKLIRLSAFQRANEKEKRFRSVFTRLSADKSKQSRLIRGQWKSISDADLRMHKTYVWKTQYLVSLNDSNRRNVFIGRAAEYFLCNTSFVCSFFFSFLIRFSYQTNVGRRLKRSRNDRNWRRPTINYFELQLTDLLRSECNNVRTYLNESL